jgi:melanoma-associated antigen
LTSTLPSEYRTPAILTPSIAPTAAEESSYIALYTTIISLISLSGGTLADPKLERYLKRLNADVNMPHEVKTEAALQRMIKQGYLVKIKENTGGEETAEWMIGSRGKIEVGNQGVKGLVATVYGDAAPEDLADRVNSSLGLEVPEKAAARRAEGSAPAGGQDAAGESSRRGGEGGRTLGRRRRLADDGDDDDD